MIAVWKASLLAAGWLVLIAASLASAQDARLALTDPRAFREAFTASPPTATRSVRAAETLVGLRVGTAGGAFEAKMVRVALGGQAASGQLCIRMMARDGRYSAFATYNPQTSSKSPAIDAPTKYENELRGYAMSDLAVAAFVAPNCDVGRAGELYAAVVGKPSKTDELVVQINAPSSRTRAQLMRGDSAIGSAILCLPIEGGPRIGFTGECRLPLAGHAAGSYRLVLTETTATGAGQARSYPLRLVTELGL